MTLTLVTALTAGCGGTQCDLADAVNQLNVKVDGFPRALDGASLVGPDLVTVQVCLATDCVSANFDGGRTDTARMELPFTSTAPVDLSVSVSGIGGVLLAPTTTYRVTPTEFSPNGPKCDPHVYRAALTVTPPESAVAPRS